MTTALVKMVTRFFGVSFPFCSVSPCLALPAPPRKSPNLEDLPLEHVAGDRYIYEELLGLKFRISPHAFFQVRMT